MNNHLPRLALALFFCCAPALLAQARVARAAPQNARAKAAHILARVQKVYHGKSVQAAFSQTYTDAITGDRPTETGTLLASGDGRVRFDYAAPNKKHFVFDGNNGYFYEPEAAQVTIMEHFADEPAAQTMAFLWGEGPLTTAFASELCEEAKKAAPQNSACLTLTPVAPMAGVERVELYVDNTTFEVQQTVVTDALGNRTRYRLESRKLGLALKPELFDFTVPQGVSVLHTRS